MEPEAWKIVRLVGSKGPTANTRSIPVVLEEVPVPVEPEAEVVAPAAVPEVPGEPLETPEELDEAVVTLAAEPEVPVPEVVPKVIPGKEFKVVGEQRVDPLFPVELEVEGVVAAPLELPLEPEAVVVAPLAPEVLVPEVPARVMLEGQVKAAAWPFRGPWLKLWPAFIPETLPPFEGELLPETAVVPVPTAEVVVPVAPEVEFPEVEDPGVPTSI